MKIQLTILQQLFQLMRDSCAFNDNGGSEAQKNLPREVTHGIATNNNRESRTPAQLHQDSADVMPRHAAETSLQQDPQSNPAPQSFQRLIIHHLPQRGKAVSRQVLLSKLQDSAICVMHARCRLGWQQRSHRSRRRQRIKPPPGRPPAPTKAATEVPTRNPWFYHKQGLPTSGRAKFLVQCKSQQQQRQHPQSAHKRRPSSASRKLLMQHQDVSPSQGPQWRRQPQNAKQERPSSSPLELLCQHRDVSLSQGQKQRRAVSPPQEGKTVKADACSTVRLPLRLLCPARDIISTLHSLVCHNKESASADKVEMTDAWCATSMLARQTIKDNAPLLLLQLKHQCQQGKEQGSKFGRTRDLDRRHLNMDTEVGKFMVHWFALSSSRRADSRPRQKPGRHWSSNFGCRPLRPGLADRSFRLPTLLYPDNAVRSVMFVIHARCRLGWQQRSHRSRRWRGIRPPPGGPPAPTGDATEVATMIQWFYRMQGSPTPGRAKFLVQSQQQQRQRPQATQRRRPSSASSKLLGRHQDVGLSQQPQGRSWAIVVPRGDKHIKSCTLHDRSQLAGCGTEKIARRRQPQNAKEKRLSPFPLKLLRQHHYVILSQGLKEQRRAVSLPQEGKTVKGDACSTLRLPLRLLWPAIDIISTLHSLVCHDKDSANADKVKMTDAWCATSMPARQTIKANAQLLLLQLKHQCQQGKEQRSKFGRTNDPAHRHLKINTRVGIFMVHWLALSSGGQADSRPCHTPRRHWSSNFNCRPLRPRLADGSLRLPTPLSLEGAVHNTICVMHARCQLGWQQRSHRSRGRCRIKPPPGRPPPPTKGATEATTMNPWFYHKQGLPTSGRANFLVQHQNLQQQRQQPQTTQQKRPSSASRQLLRQHQNVSPSQGLQGQSCAIVAPEIEQHIKTSSFHDRSQLAGSGTDKVASRYQLVGCGTDKIASHYHQAFVSQRRRQPQRAKQKSQSSSPLKLPSQHRDVTLSQGLKKQRRSVSLPEKGKTIKAEACSTARLPLRLLWPAIDIVSTLHSLVCHKNENPDPTDNQQQ